MKQYINKSDLVEALNKMIKSISRLLDLSENRNRDLDIHLLAKVCAFEDILDFLDTLEVKEVDCEREIGIYTTKELLQKRNKATNVFHLTQGDIDRIAKHFYELGLKAKGE